MKKTVVCLLMCIVVFTLPADAADPRVTMWRVDGASNSVFLLGSIHMLRQSDYPIPAAIYDAYEMADTLIMELDMDDMDPLAMQSLVIELGMLGDGETLEDVLGTTTYRKAVQLAEELEVPLTMMGATKPWFAAMTVEVLIMSRLGFDPAQGVEMHLMNKARTDGKEILGLETERQQLEMLDGLSARAQRDMLMQTLEDGGKLADMLDELIAAWRSGDVDFMQRALLDDMRGYRELYKRILVDRNTDWVRQITPLLHEEDNYLIVVGSLHLVGPDGVPALLRQRGLDVEQVADIR